jgi:eukaryotic-like serine/threonine-protein kinase
LEEQENLVLGDTLGGRYVLSNLLGAGGMAEVFMAHDRLLDRDLALKILREDYAKDAAFVERFRKEARSAASLSHPNVVQVYDQGRAEDGRYYIAMEHVPGGSLRDLILRRGVLDPAEAARLASQVAEALHAAHERGIVHRDIKPQNVLLDETGDAKVADFGIAVAASRTSTSGTNQVFGSPTYMSPEQAMGEQVGPASDLYSLGIVLYEMLTGSVPSEAEGALATAMKHVTEQPLSPRERDPSIPEAMDALVMGLLAKNPEDRCQSAAHFAEDLRRAQMGLPLAFLGASGYPETVREPSSAAGGAHSGEPGSKPRMRKRPVVTGLVALAVLLALLGALGWDLTRAPEGSKAVGALTTSEGGRQGGTLGAPEGSENSPNDGPGKVVGPGITSTGPAGGAPVAASAPPTPASASASPASGAASASATPEPPAPGVSSGSGGQGTGMVDPGGVESAAQEQYR